jgi:hypothetical protein
MASRKISKRKWSGNAPEGAGWDEAGITPELHGVKWVISKHIVNFENVEGPPSKWRPIKITSVEPVEKKANYSTAWNGERLAVTKDLLTMREYRPDLESAVVAVLAGAA